MVKVAVETWGPELNSRVGCDVYGILVLVKFRVQLDLIASFSPLSDFP